MKKKFIISVMFEDRVGIIADVTETVKNLGGNLEDITQTVMRGYFSMILLAAFDNDMTAETIQNRLSQTPGCEQFSISVREFNASAAPAKTNGSDADDNPNVYMLTASGPDQSGLVAKIAGYLKERDINIRDLTTCVTDSGDYSMIMEIVIPADTDVSQLQRSLATCLASNRLNIGLRHYRLFRETNEI